MKIHHHHRYVIINELKKLKIKLNQLLQFYQALENIIQIHLVQAITQVTMK